MFRYFSACFLLISITVSSGCSRTEPIYNVENAAVPVAAEELTTNQVRNAIARALVQKGWSISGESKGQLEAVIHPRKHMALIDIEYSTTRYSIRYKDSAILRYDGTEIHRNYNKWIRNLQNAINRELLVR